VSILVVAESGFHRLYRSLSIPDKKLAECVPSEAFDSIEKHKADIVLLDCGSDVEKGLAILKEIKSRFPRVPVIVLSERGSEDIVLKSFRAGARDFFKTPVTLDELRETVEGILAVRKSSVERRNPFRSPQPRKDDSFTILTSSYPVSIIRVMRHIEEHLSSRLSLDELAKQADMSKYHFCRFFNRHIGMSPMKYLTSRRIAKAKDLIRKEDVPISVVASSVGFNDMSSFCVQFKHFTGTTPIKYKLSCKKARIERARKTRERLLEKGGREGARRATRKNRPKSKKRIKKSTKVIDKEKQT